MFRETTTAEKIALAVTAIAGAVLIFSTPLRTSGQILYAALTVLSALFVVVYAARSNWRATAAGRALMYSMSTLSALGMWVNASLTFGNAIPFRDNIRSVLLLVFVVTLVNLNQTLRREQRKTADLR